MNADIYTDNITYTNVPIKIASREQKTTAKRIIRELIAEQKVIARE